MNKFIFDVDGTLTPSRSMMNREFAVWFSRFCDTHDVYLVTGSDRPKTIEQVGNYIYHKCKRVYNCSGSDVWSGDLQVRTNSWTLPKEANEWLNKMLSQSQFPLRTGMHIENRAGMVNFSIVGRNANQEQRKQYVEWDTKQNERQEIAREFNYMFPELQARSGGETGIDIAPKGADKSQILVDFNHEDTIYFFGDRMDEGGNDYPLKKALWDGYYNQKCIAVKDWQDTWEQLECV